MKLQNLLLGAAALSTLFGCGGSNGGSNIPAAFVQITSTFDNDADGWTVSGDANGNSVLPTYSNTGGNPGGYVSAKDDVTGGTWYWQAPAKFLGDQSLAYGKVFKFEQRVTDTSLVFDESKDVILKAGDTTLTFDVATTPGTNWTAASVLLNESSGWKLANGNTATPEQFKAALKAISGLFIRGEFRTGPDTGSLDNVAFGADSQN